MRLRILEPVAVLCGGLALGAALAALTDGASAWPSAGARALPAPIFARARDRPAERLARGARARSGRLEVVGIPHDGTYVPEALVPGARARAARRASVRRARDAEYRGISSATSPRY